MRATGVVILAVFATSAQAACDSGAGSGAINGCDSGEWCDGSTCKSCRKKCADYTSSNTPEVGSGSTADKSWYLSCKAPRTLTKAWGARDGGCCSHADCDGSSYCAKADRSYSVPDSSAGICTKCTGSANSVCKNCDTIEEGGYASICTYTVCGGSLPAKCQCQGQACTGKEIGKAVAAFASWIIVVLVVIPLLCLCGCIAFCFCTGAMCFKASQPQTVVMAQGQQQQPMYQKQ